MNMDWMNLLIYISGWYWGIVLGNNVLKPGSDNAGWASLVAWTMTWVWICWRFIR